MKPLFDITKLNSYKSRDKVPLECAYCHKTFYILVKIIRESISGNPKILCLTCSKKCGNLYRNKNNFKLLPCKQCGLEIKRTISDLSKGHKNTFCSHSCSAIFNKSHRNGNQRSKLEKYIQSKLTLMYPKIEILFNNREIIQAELDIYIPQLKLAFELNGIFHYEPIFGQEKLNKVKNNDHRKFQACAEKQISLCVIDTSKQKYFKETSSIEFLNIITRIINNKLAEHEPSQAH